MQVSDMPEYYDVKHNENGLLPNNTSDDRLTDLIFENVVFIVLSGSN